MDLNQSIKKIVILNPNTIEIVNAEARRLAEQLGLSNDRAFSLALRGIILEWNQNKKQSTEG